MKICWFSDLDLSGSGYKNLTVPLCEGLAARGHEIKVSGLGYQGQQHDYSFSIFPAMTIRDGMAIIENLYNLWGFDMIVVALDIPLHLNILKQMGGNKPFKYAGIMPVEADPLTLSWAMGLTLMDKAFIISEFGKKACIDQGIQAEFLQIGIDTESWRIPKPEEKSAIRKNLLGLDDSNYVIFTVADNQERKNLASGMEIVSKFICNGNHPEARYIMITREFNSVGWILKDLAQEFDINDKIMIFERGMDFKKLWSLYAASDLFFLPSKTEGLGMPLLEAMSVGLPCIATDCTGMRELLSDGRGLLVDWVHIFPDCSYRDPFGNGRRYIISPEAGVEAIKEAAELTNRYAKGRISRMTKKARKYAESRTWDVAVDQLEKGLLELVGK